MILDSGGVLIRPSNGCWLPSAAFDQVLAGRGVSYDVSLLPAAAAAGASYLEDVHPVRLADEAAERLIWRRYYHVVLEGVGIADGSGELARSDCLLVGDRPRDRGLPVGAAHAG